MSTKFNLTIEEVNINNRRLVPQAVVQADSFMELLHQTCIFIEKHDRSFLDGCVVIINEPPNNNQPFIPFHYFASKMTEHMFCCMQMGTKDIDDFVL